MVQLDHLTIYVSNLARSRAWYVATLALKVEFEIPPIKGVSLQDSSGFSLFIQERPAGEFAPSCMLTFQVDDVESKCRQLASQGIALEAAPQKLPWGYGAELLDPDGYVVRLWDQQSMREKG